MHMHGHDVYVCRAHAVPTLIARKSDDPPDYRAVMMAMVIRAWVRIGVSSITHDTHEGNEG
jgi:hypothetical protein